MILIDTNVISEPLRPAPQARVIAWIDAQPLETLFLSAITVAELRFGVASLPAGKRRSSIDQRANWRPSNTQLVVPALVAGGRSPFSTRAARSAP